MGNGLSQTGGRNKGYNKRYILPMEIALDLIRDSNHQDREHGFIFKKGSGNRLSVERRIVGKEVTVTIPGDHTVTGHTHPSYLYGDLRYHPPSGTDYVQSIWDTVRGAEISMVIEPSGIWVYKPNAELVDYIAKKQPDMLQLLGSALGEGEERREITGVSDDIFDMVDVVMQNTDTSNIALTQPPDVISEIRQMNGGVLPDGYSPIKVKQYLHEIATCVDGEKLGFDVKYFSTMDFDVAEKAFVIDMIHRSFTLALKESLQEGGRYGRSGGSGRYDTYDGYDRYDTYGQV